MELNEYILMWLHHYLFHVGIAAGVLIGATAYKNGVPLTWRGIWDLVSKGAVLGALLALFTSFSHNHYSHYLSGLIK